MRNSRIDVRPIAGACGAEIHGADIADDLDDDVISEIRQALNQHGVIFFRDQDFDAEQHKASAALAISSFTRITAACRTTTRS